jgi:hypothetical protein
MQAQSSRSRLLLGLPLFTALSLMPFSFGSGQEGPTGGLNNVGEGGYSPSQQPKRGFGDGLKLLIPNDNAGVSLGGVGQTGDSLSTVRKEIPSATVGLPSEPAPAVVAAPPASLSQPRIINLDDPTTGQYQQIRPGVVTQDTTPRIINLPNLDASLPHFGGQGYGGGHMGHANHAGNGGGIQAGHFGGHTGTASASHGSSHSGGKR